MFEHPYFLGLFGLLLAFLAYRSGRYYLRHAYISSMRTVQGGHGWTGRVQSGFYAMGWAVLVIAAANPIVGRKEQVRKQAVHKYVMINDASGSMVDSQKERGVGAALMAIEAGNAAMIDLLDKRADGSKDYIGATVFDTESYVVSYLVDDPQFVGTKLKSINYNKPPLGGGTQVDKALWGGILMTANHEDHLTKDEVETISIRMFGGGVSYKNELDAVIKKCLPITDGTSLVLFTDGGFANPQGGPRQMSAFKLLALCKDLKIRVYIISVDVIQPDILRAIKDTGGNGIVRRTFDPEAFRQIYKDIVESQTTETVIVDQEVKQSLGTILGTVAGAMLCTAFFLSQTLNRKYTEV